MHLDVFYILSLLEGFTSDKCFKEGLYRVSRWKAVMESTIKVCILKGKECIGNLMCG